MFDATRFLDRWSLSPLPASPVFVSGRANWEKFNSAGTFNRVNVLAVSNSTCRSFINIIIIIIFFYSLFPLTSFKKRALSISDFLKSHGGSRLLLRAVLKAQIYFVSHRFLDEKFLVLGWHRNHDETRIKLTRLRCRRGGEETMAQSRHTLGTHSTLYKARNPYYARIIWSFTRRWPREDPLPPVKRDDDTYFPGTRSNYTILSVPSIKEACFLTNACCLIPYISFFRKSEGNIIRAGGSETIILLLIKEVWRRSRKIST